LVVDINGRSGYGAGSIFTAFILGAVTGAVITYLTSPESGAEARERIKDVARKVGKGAAELPRRWEESWNRATDAARNAYDDISQREGGDSTRATDVT
jgi:gas vesicle protein